MLIQRREKIKSIYLTQVNPIVNPTLDAKGLTFENAAVTGGVAQGTVAYRASWMSFDNATGATKPIAETKGTTTTIAAPAGLPSSGFVAVDIAADSDTYPTWKKPVRAFFRQDGARLEAGRARTDGRHDPGRTTGPTEGGEVATEGSGRYRSTLLLSASRTSRSASSGNRKRSSTRRVAAARTLATYSACEP